MATLTEELEAYEALRLELESKALGQWVLVHDRQLINTYPSFEQAAEEAVEKFGRGPYLIKQIGAPPVTRPASVMFSPLYAQNS